MFVSARQPLIFPTYKYQGKLRGKMSGDGSHISALIVVIKKMQQSETDS